MAQLLTSYCVYVTHHATGKFYVGKAATVDVLSGQYKGSGTRLLDAFKKYPRHEWTTEIICCYETEEAAYQAEAELVNEQLLQNPFCQNINLGGKGGCRRTQSAKEIAKRVESIKRAKSSKEHRTLMSKVSAAASARPEVREKRINHSKRLWATPEARNKMLAARADSYDSEWKSKLSEKTKTCRRQPFAVEVDGVVYQRQADACRALGLHRKMLRKLPTFREIV